MPQEETLRQKAGVLAVIEELGKLEPLMAEAAVEEVATLALYGDSVAKS